MKLYIGNLGDDGKITSSDLRPLFEQVSFEFPIKDYIHNTAIFPFKALIFVLTWCFFCHFFQFGTVSECECIKNYAFVHMDDGEKASEAVSVSQIL